MTAIRLSAPPPAANLAEHRFRGPWCIVRFHRGRFLGPLSPYRSFPEGEIADVMWFGSETEASASLESEPCMLPETEDRVMAAEELHFSTHYHCFYDGESGTVYDGGSFIGATAAKWMKLGQLASMHSRMESYKVTLGCRLAGPEQVSAEYVPPAEAKR